MDLPLVIALIGASVFGIVMAIDFPMSHKTMWLFVQPIPKEPLSQILGESPAERDPRAAKHMSLPRAGSIEEWWMMHQ